MQDQEPEKTAKYLRVKVVDHTKEGHPAVNAYDLLGVDMATAPPRLLPSTITVATA